MRRTMNLNADWYFRKTDQCPEALPKDWESISLPHTWNNIDGQDGGNDYYRGKGMYVKELVRPNVTKDHRIFIEFQGAGQSADVYINNEHVGSHHGGYSTFRFDITPYFTEKRILLSVCLDNGPNDTIYPQKADFTFYGGLYRDVNLIVTEASHFDLLHYGTPGIKVTPTLVPSTDKDYTVSVEGWYHGDADSILLTVQDANTLVTKELSLEQGYAAGSILLKDAHLWDGLKDPHLYTATLQLSHNGHIVDEISSTFGCRSFSFDAEKGFFLNGRSYPLRGVSRHQDRIDVGNALTKAMHEEDMQIIREIGANTIRLAHYQHDQYVYDLCDKEGFVIWAEIPYITQHMPNGRQNTLDQMTDLVTQSYNHPSIVCWGLSNEITAGSPVDEDMLENHRLLNDLCHKLDTTRPTTMAHVFMLEIENSIIDIPDIGSYNLYFGWYLGELEQNDSFFDTFHEKYPKRIIGFSEYGADANPAYQNAAPERGDYSESYQALYHEHMVRCINERPYLWATHVWNMFDFAADGRDEGGKHGVNQKGLVTMDRKIKKDAFYLYKAYWSDIPFVHITGKRFVNRTDDHITLKIYSNQPSVTLYVDDTFVATKVQEQDKVFTFSIPLTGEHNIKVTSGVCSDETTIIKTDTADERYIMPNSRSIINWFDKDDFDPTCYSIKDTLGTLKANPESGVIINAMMAKMTEKRGDVASATAGNKALEDMMAAIPLEKLLKQAGDFITPEIAKDMNHRLQQIKK